MNNKKALPLHIKYAICHSEEILEQIGKQVSSSKSSDFLSIESDTVVGKLYGQSLNRDLSIYGVAIMVNKEMMVTRSGTKNSDLIILDFHIDSFAKLFLDSGHSQLITGSYLSSSSYASSAEYIPGTESKFVSLILTKKWLEENISISESRLKEILRSEKYFFFFREIGYQLMSEVHDLFQAIYGNNKMNDAYLYGCTYKILSLYFKEFALEKDTNSSFNTYDLKAIEEVKNYIDLNPNKKIKLKELLEIAAMSESKFRTLFKSVVGSSPSDYHINRKIWYAKSLIESGMPISSVVIQIGYSNHSYFTRTFKSIFGLTPQKYQEESARLKKLGITKKGSIN